MQKGVYNCDIKTKANRNGSKERGNKMKKIISLILTAAMLCAAVFALGSCGGDNLSAAYDKIVAKYEFDDSKCEKTLTVAMSPDFAPMEFVDLAKKGNDQYVGFDVILAKYLAKELNMKLVIDPMSFDACMAAVSTGQADLAISGFSWTAARAETFLISDYYVAGENESDQILISLADDKADFAANKTDFTGLKIGAQGGSLQELLVKEQLVTKGAAIELYKDLNTAVEALKSGEIDALAVAKGNGEAFAASSDNVVLTDYYFEVEEKYKNNVILLNKNDADLLADVNAALDKAMKADVYDTWYEACQIYAEVKTADQLGYDDEGNKITE